MRTNDANAMTVEATHAAEVVTAGRALATVAGESWNGHGEPSSAARAASRKSAASTAPDSGSLVPNA
jgi:hypothetical protein